MTREEAISVLKETIDPNIDKIFKEWKEWDKEKHLPAVNMAIDALQAEPKRGTWTITETYDCEIGEIPHLICSECKSEPMAWSSKRLFNYCPNCGAKMKGQEE